MSGWDRRMVGRLVNIIILMSLFQSVWAMDDEVDLDLLEFLGEWETDEGEWVDPEQLDEEENEDEKTTE